MSQPIRFGITSLIGGKGYMPGASVTLSTASSGKLQATFTLPSSASAGTGNKLWCISVAHLWVGNALADMPQATGGNPSPGQFPYTAAWASSGHQTITVSTDLPCLATDQVAVAHTTIVPCSSFEFGPEVTGFAGGASGPTGNRWWNYFNFTCGSCSATGVATTSATSTTATTCGALPQSYPDYRAINSGAGPRCTLQQAVGMLDGYNCVRPDPNCNLMVCTSPTAMDPAIAAQMEQQCAGTA